MAFETFQDILQQTTVKVGLFWEELKRGDINVFALHNLGIKVSVALSEARRTMRKAIEKTKDVGKQKLYFLYSQFNESVLDNELEAWKCHRKIRLLHSMNKAEQISIDSNADDEHGLIIVSGCAWY